MRQRPVLALAVSAILTLLFLLRYHLQDGAETVWTDATFYTHLQQHRELLYRFPSNSIEATGKDENELVPPLLHQISLTEGLELSLSRYEEAMTSCQSLHPNWTHHLWTDENATAFMTEYYQNILPHYLSYRQSIQRAKILRYALLDHYGGVYLDLDVTCLQPFDELRGLSWLTVAAYPAGVDNAFILSRPHHSLLRLLLGGVESRSLTWSIPYVEDMLSAGRAYFSNRWMSYARSLARRRAGEVSPKDRIYVLADREGNLGTHMLRGAVTTPLFRREGANSWYGWDATTIVMIGQHYKYFMAMMGLGAVFTTACLFKISRRRTRSKIVVDLMSGREGLEKTDDTESGCTERGLRCSP